LRSHVDVNAPPPPPPPPQPVAAALTAFAASVASTSTAFNVASVLGAKGRKSDAGRN